VTGVPQLVELRTSDQFNATPLMFAAMGNQLPVVRLLLEHGADITAVDRSALRVTNHTNHNRIIRFVARRLQTY